MLVETPPRPASTDEFEALIREARERQRRRRWRGAALIVGLVLLAAVAFGIARSGGGGAPTVERVPNGPVVNVGAFSGRGRLAFISGSTLWLLDGTTSKLHRLPTPGGFVPSQPVFSFDGRWLAYLEQHRGSATGDDYARLWIAHADGSDAHVVPGLTVYSLIGWSPNSDLVAVAAGPERTTQPCPCYSPTTLRIVSADRSYRTVARTSWLYGGSWSPDGTKLVVADDRYPHATIAVYSASAGRGTTWLRMKTRQRLNGMNGVLFDVAGWWPHLGIGFWVFGDGMVHNNDNTPLDLIASPGASPRLLGQTLSDGTTDAVAASSSGGVAIVTDHGGGRAAWQDKTVELCTSGAGGCRALPHASGEVTLDPAWAPDGKTLAYIEAPNVRTGPWSQQAIAGWFAAHRVLLYDTSTGHIRPLPAAHGATAITWSRNGRSLLYVRDDALWLLPTLHSRPVRIGSPLFVSHNWPQYYAQIAWASQFAWASNRP
jgi:Tol biopolymer transport system component